MSIDERQETRVIPIDDIDAFNDATNTYEDEQQPTTSAPITTEQLGSMNNALLTRTPEVDEYDAMAPIYGRLNYGSSVAVDSETFRVIDLATAEEFGRNVHEASWLLTETDKDDKQMAATFDAFTPMRDVYEFAGAVWTGRIEALHPEWNDAEIAMEAAADARRALKLDAALRERGWSDSDIPGAQVYDEQAIALLPGNTTKTETAVPVNVVAEAASHGNAEASDGNQLSELLGASHRIHNAPAEVTTEAETHDHTGPDEPEVLDDEFAESDLFSKLLPEDWDEWTGDMSEPVRLRDRAKTLALRGLVRALDMGAKGVKYLKPLTERLGTKKQARLEAPGTGYGEHGDVIDQEAAEIDPDTEVNIPLPMGDDMPTVDPEKKSRGKVAAKVVGGLMLGGLVVLGLNNLDSTAPNETGPGLATSAPAAAPEQAARPMVVDAPATPQESTTTLDGRFNPRTGENSISHVALEQARRLGYTNLSPRQLVDLTDYFVGYDAEAHRQSGQSVVAPTQMPVGYTISRPSDDMVRNLLEHLKTSN